MYDNPLVDLIFQRFYIASSFKFRTHQRFANDLLMIFIDMLLGAYFWPIFFTILFRPSLFFLYGIDPFFHHYLCNMITWFMGWPAGFKLNNPLNTFFGNMFLWALHVWRGLFFCLVIYLIANFIPYLQSCIRTSVHVFTYQNNFIYFSRVFGAVLGASSALTLLGDLFAISSLHLYLFYRVSSKMLAAQISMLLTLFRLFRGK